MRLCGSADLYERNGKAPVNSINFVTCHDGMTLNDVVSYASKHNLANGEGNRDGADENFSANYGIEGTSDDMQIERIRVRQIKNLLATLALSRGVPMMLGGDEFRRTQFGDNNPWCQDNTVSWYDWRLVERQAEIVRFTREVMACRKRYPTLVVEAFYSEDQLHWFAPGGNVPDWNDTTHALGYLVRPASTTLADGNPQGGTVFVADSALCMLFNAGDWPVEFCLPSIPDQAWHRVLDTSLPAPDDICGSATTPLIRDSSRYTLAAHALAMLCSGTFIANAAGPSDIATDPNCE
jgi:isoamylase